MTKKQLQKLTQLMREELAALVAEGVEADDIQELLPKRIVARFGKNIPPDFELVQEIVPDLSPGEMRVLATQHRALGEHEAALDLEKIADRREREERE